MIIAFFSLLSRLLGLLRDRLLFGAFGAGDSLDAYYAAFRLPDLVFNTLVLGALSAAFIPVFLQYWRQDRDEAWKIANSLLNIMLVVLLVFGMLAFYFAPEIISLSAPGFSLEKRIATAELARIMLVGIIFLALSNVASSVLNSFKRFTAFALAPVMYNLGIIAGIFFFVPWLGLSGLAWGVVFGAFLHFFVQLPAVARLGFKYRLIFSWRSRGLRQIGKLMLPRTFSLAINQINQLVNTVIASTLPAGAVAIFNAANNLQVVPIGIFAIPIALAYFPVFSEAWANKDRAALVSSFSRAFRRLLFIAIPAAVFMILLRAHIVRLVLGAGAFDWGATVLTAQTLAYFAVSLFAQSLAPLIARVYYALQDTRTPLLLGLASLAINVALSFPLAERFGVAGLGLAFSIASIINVFLLWLVLRWKLGDLDDKKITSSALQITLGAVLSGWVLYGTLYFVAPWVDTRTGIGLLLQASAAALAGGAAYLGLGRLMKMEEMKLGS